MSVQDVAAFVVGLVAFILVARAVASATRPDRTGQIQYVGVVDCWMEADRRCLACDALIAEKGGFFFFEDTPYLCCVGCFDTPVPEVASNLFKATGDYRLHAHFCGNKGCPTH